MGQKRPVQIVNFVAKGTIEEGMLATLAFKRSLSAGVLDGGVGEISLGGSRLSRFMKDVVNVTGHMGSGETLSPDEEFPATTVEGGDGEASEIPGTPVAMAAESPTPAGASEAPPPPATLAPAAAAPADPWGALVEVGSQLLAALASGHDAGAPSHPWVEQDARTGSRHLKIPMPPPETANRLADALGALAQALRH
jgi:hypothetical protein